ncbi:MAG: hypothetical protein M1816_006154 [Peltula sp. TS41687]|nr:MAG: hypothetical protein M1816_006154 [Peltula sp. TS41687]
MSKSPTVTEWALQDEPTKREFDVFRKRSPGSRAARRWCGLRASGIYLGILLIAVLVIWGAVWGTIHHHERTRKEKQSTSSQQPRREHITDAADVGPTEIWKPRDGTAWQIVLYDAVDFNNLGLEGVDVFDIDLFDNDASTIAMLHRQGKKVICYFSAGSYENFRPDSGSFTKDDCGKPLGGGWKGEWWLNTQSANVRRVMKARMDLAVSKHCDGVDPDNVDGYDNDTGLSLSQNSAVDYIRFLADEAHARKLSIGLKNGGAIVDRVLDKMEWEINEQCLQYHECNLYRPFIDARKPVFHIEYAPDETGLKGTKLDAICRNATSSGFSTLIKTLKLTQWYQNCP